MYPPSAPAGVSITQNMRVASAQRQHSAKGAALLMSWFQAKVRSRGEWDYKRYGRNYQLFASFNYGACGIAAGISQHVLLRGAGCASGQSGASGTWWGDAPYGDGHRDQDWIKAGIEYAKSMGY